VCCAIAGDVWYFPANLPHSFVGLEPTGCLFVSGYKSADFDELKAFSASSWLATLPVDTLAQASFIHPRPIALHSFIILSVSLCHCLKVNMFTD
jgi:hypothetical protein